MAAGRRVADIGAGGIVAVLVLKDAVQHQELLAAAMGVRREVAVPGVADDGGGAGHLVPDAVEHAAVHPGDGEGVQSSRAACTAARAPKSALRFMSDVFRHAPRKRGSRGSAADLAALGSRFRGNDETWAQSRDAGRIILGQGSQIA